MLPSRWELLLNSAWWNWNRHLAFHPAQLQRQHITSSIKDGREVLSKTLPSIFSGGNACLRPGFSIPDHSIPSKQLLMMTASQAAGACWRRFSVACHPRSFSWQRTTFWTLTTWLCFSLCKREETGAWASLFLCEEREAWSLLWMDLLNRGDVWDCSCPHRLNYNATSVLRRGPVIVPGGVFVVTWPLWLLIVLFFFLECFY